jgi:hypothetical protein
VSSAAILIHTASTGVASPGLLPYLLTTSRPLALVVIMYYAVRATVFLLASVVAIYTKDERRRKACLEIVRAVSRGWPWHKNVTT